MKTSGASKTSKLRLLLALLASNPPEFIDRVRAVLEVNLDRLLQKPPVYPAMPWDQLLNELTRALGADAAALDREVDSHGLEPMIADGIARLGAAPQFALRHNADARIARLCYIVCRALRPDTVVETGVAYGVTTTFVLKALEINGAGHLYSIDLPPLGADADDSVGRLVPQYLRSRWTLLRGSSRRVLPPLLARLRQIDLFIHDSLHTFQNMRSEFAAAQRHRADPFVLIADDIELNRAFEEHLEQGRRALSFHATWAANAKQSRAGICIVASVRPRA
jgi:hypothetical protein